MKVGILQLNPTVGALEANLAELLEALHTATGLGAELAVAPELSVVGYPPRDLLDSSEFIRAIQEVTRQLVAATADTPLIFGTVGVEQDGRLLNQAVIAQHGRELARATKRLLPTYDVFDELRHFSPGHELCEVALDGRRCVITICEDVWGGEAELRRRYGTTRLSPEDFSGASLHVNLSASPFTLPKRAQRDRLFSSFAQQSGVPLLMVNQVGGNDDLIFDGASGLWNADGRLIGRAARFSTDVVVMDTQAQPILEHQSPEPELAYEALVLGTRDYARKCGFSRAVLGLSGGIDSALVAAIAADALGPENVLGMAMPSRYSSAGSIDDAQALASNLGIRFEIVKIEAMFSAYLGTLAPLLDGLGTEEPGDVTWENVQARIRGALVMAISNRTGALPLTTGNKSELAVGYCTLYGDMAGGLAVISDLPKTLVYEVSRWRNQRGPAIPENTLVKAPSAELRPDQRDDDSLPPYEVLDPLLVAIVEEHKTREQLIAQGHDPAVVTRVMALVRRAEYKRRQAAPGLIVTKKAFGSGRRVPVAQGYAH